MTPADVVEGWMNSEGHRKNILRPEYNYIGVAYLHKSNSEYGRYWVKSLQMIKNLKHYSERDTKKIVSLFYLQKKKG